MRREKWIMEAYEASEEKERLDMYMICRDHREEFDEIDASSSVRERKMEPEAEAKPARAKWNCCGLLMRAFGARA